MSNSFDERLAEVGLSGLRSVLENVGVRSFQCLSTLRDEEIFEIRRKLRAAGFGAGHARSFELLCREGRAQSPDQPRPKRSRVGSPCDADTSVQARASAETVGDDEAEEEGPGRDVGPAASLSLRRFSAITRTEQPIGPTSAEGVAHAQVANAKDILCPTIDDTLMTVKHDHSNGKVNGDDTHMKVTTRKWVLCSNKPRASRQDIVDNICGLRKMEAEVVSYRDGKTGKMAEARVPEIILALLRLHASCSGKEVTEQRIARLAVDLLEEQGYDPVRAVSSLSPASLLLPEAAVRVIGSGYVGVVFLEESSGDVVKVMLDESGRGEYDVFCDFAEASLAVKPISCIGPRVVPGGQLYSIRMEAVPDTLQGILSRRAPRGVRHGFSPPTEERAQLLGQVLELALERLIHKQLVHADLHMGNIGIKDLGGQPSIALIDFGNSACLARDKGVEEWLAAGHEFDILRLMGDMCDSFEAVQEEFEETRKECERELRELRREQGHGDLHRDRQVAALQAYLAEETLEKVEMAYNIILKMLVKYANTKCSWAFEGDPCIKNRRMRQAAAQRMRAVQSQYFNGFWTRKDGA